MSTRHRQRGVSGALIAIVLVLVLVGFLGSQLVGRILGTSRSEERLQAQFAAAARALEQYVATAQRLPCPADPTLDAGEEVLPAPNAATCSFPQGTLPWKAIGLARDDAIDVWGQKISYRVYTGAAGSLTQPGGAGMIQCDTVEATPAGATAAAGGAGGLCRPDTRITLRDTPPATFLAGKGLALNDMGTARTDVAYVLVSHGASGLGAYTATRAPATSVRREMPLGDELANTAASGPFVIKAFSASGTDPALATHFDDFVAYRRIEDLIKSAGVYARDWPEEVTTTVTFDQPTVEAAVGGPVTPGSGVGQVSVTFTGVVAAAIDSGGNPIDVGFAVWGSVGGIGVAGGGSAFLQSSASESLRLQFVERATKFGVTLNHFGYYGSGPTFEIVEFRFYSGTTQIGASQFVAGCRVDGGLASFSLVADAMFDRVDIVPFPAFDFNTFSFSGLTAILVSAVKACPAAESVCTSPLAAPSNNC